ncbi:MAG: translation initiation factor IF-2 subunit alpha [Thermoplasmata archaeon]|nr:translation initiation factor IF-2 subunit alpha [Thermoplasmata archaeon]
MPQLSEYPEDGELVVCTVSNVKNFGAFVTLDEYEGKEGFIHVRDVATGWVKYIRDYVREGQKIVCKVLAVDPSKGHIDLSLKQVNEHQKREKIQAWKNEKKAEKLFELVAAEMGKKVEEINEDLLPELYERYGSPYAAFEEAALNLKAFKKESGKKKWVDAFAKVAKENIQPPKVEIVAILELTCPDSQGIVHIRNAMMEESASEKAEMNFRYMGAPRYRVEVSAADYKTAEDELKKHFENIESKMHACGGRAKLVREQK